jgi:hypothetical protein
LEEQLSVFHLHELMHKITFVSDRGSNFVSALREYDVLYCVAHRLNNILKRTFYQGLKKKKKNVTPAKSFMFSTNITTTEVTPTKTGRTTTTTTTTMASPDITGETFDEDMDGESEESSDEDADDDDVLDYTAVTVAELNPAAKQVLDTITHCKSLVKYAKKV